MASRDVAVRSYGLALGFVHCWLRIVLVHNSDRRRPWSPCQRWSHFFQKKGRRVYTHRHVDFRRTTSVSQWKTAVHAFEGKLNNLFTSSFKAHKVFLAWRRGEIFLTLAPTCVTREILSCTMSKRGFACRYTSETTDPGGGAAG